MAVLRGMLFFAFFGLALAPSARALEPLPDSCVDASTGGRGLNMGPILSGERPFGATITLEPYMLPESELSRAQRRLPAAQRRRLRRLPARTIRIGPTELREIGRAVCGEAEAFNRRHQAMIIWTMIQRMARYRAYHDMDLVEYLHTFSQPVNPRHRAGGDACPETGGKGTGCSPRRISRRTRISRAGWYDLDEDCRRTALDFALGRLRNPIPAAINFAGGSAHCHTRPGEAEHSRDPVPPLRGPHGELQALFCHMPGTPNPAVTVHSPSWLRDCGARMALSGPRVRRGRAAARSAGDAGSDADGASD